MSKRQELTDKAIKYNIQFKNNISNKDLEALILAYEAKQEKSKSNELLTFVEVYKKEKLSALEINFLKKKKYAEKLLTNHDWQLILKAEGIK